MAQTHRKQLLASRPGLSIAEKVMKLLIGAFLGCTVFRLPCRDHHLPVHFDPKKKAIRPAWTLRLDCPPRGGNLFFQPVNARYEKGATILTSNRGFAEWGEVFGDPVVATALLDRLLHHDIVIQIEGSSYRLRQHADLVPEHIRFQSTGLSSGASVTRDVSAVPLSDAIRRS
jgi:hypothetical protein